MTFQDLLQLIRDNIPSHQPNDSVLYKALNEYHALFDNFTEEQKSAIQAIDWSGYKIAQMLAIMSDNQPINIQNNASILYNHACFAKIDHSIWQAGKMLGEEFLKTKSLPEAAQVCLQPDEAMFTAFPDLPLYIFKPDDFENKHVGEFFIGYIKTKIDDNNAKAEYENNMITIEPDPELESFFDRILHHKLASVLFNPPFDSYLEPFDPNFLYGKQYDEYLDITGVRDGLTRSVIAAYAQGEAGRIDKILLKYPPEQRFMFLENLPSVVEALPGVINTVTDLEAFLDVLPGEGKDSEFRMPYDSTKHAYAVGHYFNDKDEDIYVMYPTDPVDYKINKNFPFIAAVCEELCSDLKGLIAVLTLGFKYLNAEDYEAAMIFLHQPPIYGRILDFIFDEKFHLLCQRLPSHILSRLDAINEIVEYLFTSKDPVAELIALFKAQPFDKIPGCSIEDSRRAHVGYYEGLVDDFCEHAPNFVCSADKLAEILSHFPPANRWSVLAAHSNLLQALTRSITQAQGEKLFIILGDFEGTLEDKQTILAATQEGFAQLAEMQRFHFFTPYQENRDFLEILEELVHEELAPLHCERDIHI